MMYVPSDMFTAQNINSRFKVIGRMCIINDIYVRCILIESKSTLTEVPAAPYIPPIDPSNASDTQNFDDTFLDMEPVLDEYVEEGETDQEPASTDTDRTDGEDSNVATPLQSRSPSFLRPTPLEVAADVFDGYSFKGRHSILMDGDEDEEEEDDEEDEDGEDGSSRKDMSSVLDSLEAVTAQVAEKQVDQECVEPKTPEARPSNPEPVIEDIPPLPPKEPASPVDESDHASTTEGHAQPEPSTPSSPDLPNKEPFKAKAVSHLQAAIPRLANIRANRVRREKSGVPALDRFLSDGDDNQETEREEDSDDDWDLIDAVDGEDMNGKGTSLFARGVVDRYRLAVFRKTTTPQRSGTKRTVSGMSKGSEVTISDVAESPSPERRRGRPTLPFKKRPRQFLRPKSPSKSNSTAKSRNHSNANTLSATSTMSSVLLSPSPGSSLPATPTLKTRESAISVGANSQSSGQSANGDAAPADVSDTVKSTTMEPEKLRTRKLRKYKENAEKVFLLFSSPRQAS